jgi:hypothetical protein
VDVKTLYITWRENKLTIYEENLKKLENAIPDYLKTRALQRLSRQMAQNQKRRMGTNGTTVTNMPTKDDAMGKKITPKHALKTKRSTETPLNTPLEKTVYMVRYRHVIHRL